MDINKDKLFKRYTTPTSKHKEEYQEVCSELEKDFGKGVWALPHKPGFTNDKLRRAGIKARERGIMKIGYLIGIVKRL